MSPVGLEALLSGLPVQRDPNLIVGFETSDDAGVYRLNKETALITTADFITPPVDDPILFGQIAAANALSDVYAMGGTPITCLNLAAFPSNKLPPEVLAGIIEGAFSKILEAGAVLAGGHTIEDDEPKFGLSVNGIVHPEKIWANSGVKPEDVLILTKPIGSGVLFNANLKKRVTEQALSACLEIITQLNKKAAEILQSFDIHAATDVTGFGLAGHALEMARGSGVQLEIDFKLVPIFEESMKMYNQGISTGMNAANRKSSEPDMIFPSDLTQSGQELCFDPQTSGGLLVALSVDQAEQAVSRLRDTGISHATVIGRAVTGNDSLLKIT